MSTLKNLIVLATRAELRASDPNILPSMRQSLLRQANGYRAAHRDILLRPCKTQGCTTIVAGADYCPRCEEEINGTPYSFANVLQESPRAFRITVYALFGLSLGLLAFLLAVIL